MITWDDPKRRENIRKHRIDHAALEPVFDYSKIPVEVDRERYGELRLQSLGMWQGMSRAALSAISKAATPNTASNTWRASVARSWEVESSMGGAWSPHPDGRSQRCQGLTANSQTGRGWHDYTLGSDKGHVKCFIFSA